MQNILKIVFFLLLTINVNAFAEDTDLQPTIDNKVNKMQTVLKLTDSQTAAIRPIIKEYISKREAVLQEVAGEGVVDHVSIKTTLKALRDIEYQKLSKILTEDQLNKWINKENLIATLNPDNMESSADEDGPTLGPSGANFKF